MSASTNKKLVLHVGCGHTLLPSFFSPGQWREIRLDIDPSVNPDYIAGMTNMAQIGDATVDAIWSSHNLEHLYTHEVPQALREFYRVLREGGIGYIMTPDVQQVAKEIAMGNLEGELYRSPAGPISPLDVLWGHHASIQKGNSFMAHKTGFTAGTLEVKLKDAGFGSVRVERRTDAFELFASAQKIAPAEPVESLFQRAVQLHTAQNWKEAETLYRQVVARQNAYWQAWYELGVVAFALNKVDEAIDSMQKVIAMQSGFAPAYRALGCFFGIQGKPQPAIENLQKSLELDPDSAEAHYNLGKAWQEQNALALAELEYRQTLRIDPNYALAHLNLGNVLKSQGEIEQAVQSYRMALKLSPDAAWIHSNILMYMNFMPGYTSSDVFAAHSEFNRRHILPLLSHIAPHKNRPDPERRLKIGYLSRDLRRHSVEYFMTPVLSRHDHERHEIFCFYTHPQSDQVTNKFRQFADRWVECPQINDEELAGKIREEEIDILVDLSGHTAHNRLPLFGRKPAPIQITYLGYPTTTGVSAFDYRISDRYIDPEINDPEIFSSENPLRLSHGFFCYQPLEDSPEINELPANHNGFITFGSLNQFPKLNLILFGYWCEILRKTPDSRLLIQNDSVQAPEIRDKLINQFRDLGIKPDRLLFRPFEEAPGYLKSYRQIDIALDSHHYNGGTTTCEALWMGVPVISLTGKRQVSRLGLSILSQAGLPDLVADTPEAYVACAANLASNLTLLNQLRSTMRERVSTSPLMDAEGFVRELETAYRSIWKTWCQRH